MCSKKTDYYFTLWLYLEILLPLVIDNIQLICNTTTTTSDSPEGVYKRVLGFRQTYPLECNPSKRSVAIEIGERVHHRRRIDDHLRTNLLESVEWLTARCEGKAHFDASICVGKQSAQLVVADLISLHNRRIPCAHWWDHPSLTLSSYQHIQYLTLQPNWLALWLASPSPSLSTALQGLQRGDTKSNQGN